MTRRTVCIIAVLFSALLGCQSTEGSGGPARQDWRPKPRPKDAPQPRLSLTPDVFEKPDFVIRQGTPTGFYASLHEQFLDSAPNLGTPAGVGWKQALHLELVGADGSRVDVSNALSQEPPAQAPLGKHQELFARWTLSVEQTRSLAPGKWNAELALTIPENGQHLWAGTVTTSVPFRVKAEDTSERGKDRAYDQRCLALQEAGNWNGVLAEANKWAAELPNSWGAFAVKGEALEALDRPSEALAAYEIAEKLYDAQAKPTPGENMGPTFQQRLWNLRMGIPSEQIQP